MSESGVRLGEAQAQRLEAMLAQIEALVGHPEVSARLRAAPGDAEWNVLQVLGHLIEMIPYWLHHCRALIQAEGEPPAFGRTLDSPERLEGVEHGDRGNLDDLTRELREEVHAAATMIKGLTAAEREKAGIHNRRGRMTVNEVVEAFVVAHAEEHVRQIKAALGD